MAIGMRKFIFGKVLNNVRMALNYTTQTRLKRQAIEWSLLYFSVHYCDY
jgi:hypothetical protein